MGNFEPERWLFLDDVRQATPERWDIVRSYASFVEYMQHYPAPPVISFDHDLSIEHYPTMEQNSDDVIDYSSHKEKSGYEAAKWLVANHKLPKLALVHSYNIVGAKNIANVLRDGGTEVWVVPYSAKAYGVDGIQRS